MVEVEFMPVGTVDEYPEGVMRKFEIAGYDIFVVRIGEKFYALDAMCTHAAGDISQGKVLEGGRVQCPKHGGIFELASGKALSPPPSFPLESYEIRVEGNEVFVGFKY